MCVRGVLIATIMHKLLKPDRLSFLYPTCYEWNTCNPLKKKRPIRIHRSVPVCLALLLYREIKVVSEKKYILYCVFHPAIPHPSSPPITVQCKWITQSHLGILLSYFPKLDFISLSISMNPPSYLIFKDSK